MKQEEKAQLSKERILNAAMEEFGMKSYNTASVNNICNDNEISKGLIYHYFGNKDELYLNCIGNCIEKFTTFLTAEAYDFSDFQVGINQYLARRFLFFRTYPVESNLFFYAVLQPPKHLEEKIQNIKAKLDKQSFEYYKIALEKVNLRDNISFDDALGYFALIQEFFNGYFQRHIDYYNDIDELIQSHEDQLLKIMNLMLYGIAKEEK